MCKNNEVDPKEFTYWERLDRTRPRLYSTALSLIRQGSRGARAAVIRTIVSLLTAAKRATGRRLPKAHYSSRLLPQLPASTSIHNLLPPEIVRYDSCP
jgi:hypothetical protein